MRTSISFLSMIESIYECFFKIFTALFGQGDEEVAGWLAAGGRGRAGLGKAVGRRGLGETN
jgi:hypothetical protein